MVFLNGARIHVSFCAVVKVSVFHQLAGAEGEADVVRHSTISASQFNVKR